MKLFLSYLRTKLGTICILLLFCGVFALVFSLYTLPVEAVAYAAVLCAAAGAAALAGGFLFYRRRCRALQEACVRALISLDGLPLPRDELEELYQLLLHTVFSEKNRIEAQAGMQRREAEDYYTLWAHQIKTPIAAMHLLLQDGTAPDREALDRELFRIEQYVSMVLSYLRLNSESSDFVFRTCELDALIRQSLRKYAKMFIQRRLSVHFEPTGLQVLTDEKWLCFVLEQLLSNAVKYTPQGGVTIRAQGRSLIIADTGIGIRAEDLPRVFEKGFTGFNGRADKKSTGIGLYLCRRVCGKLGCALSIRSEPGRGTEVTLRFDAEKGLME